MNICLKCGGTGLTLESKPCDCGAFINNGDLKSGGDSELIPDLYRNQSEIVGLNEIIAGDLTDDTFQDKLEKLAQKFPQTPTLFIDLSECQLGAYEAYYAFVEKLDKLHKLNDRVLSQLMVNEINERYFISLNTKLLEGKSGVNPIIFSDYPTKKYEKLNEYIKIFQMKELTSIDNLSKYPITGYLFKIKSVGMVM